MLNRTKLVDPSPWQFVQLPASARAPAPAPLDAKTNPPSTTARYTRRSKSQQLAYNCYALPVHRGQRSRRT